MNSQRSDDYASAEPDIARVNEGERETATTRERAQLWTRSHDAALKASNLTASALYLYVSPSLSLSSCLSASCFL